MQARGWPMSASTRYHVEVHIWPKNRRRADVDNYAKNFLDACNGVLWPDDSQIDRLLVERMPHDKDNPRTVISVTAQPPQVP